MLGTCEGTQKMWLKGKKLRGKSIIAPLYVKFPAPITDERLAELVPRLRLGDESVYDEIFFGHIRLAISIVSKYVWQCPKLEDDLLAEGMYALTIAIKHARHKLRDNNITPWITTNVHRYLSACIDKHRNRKSDLFKSELDDKEIIEREIQESIEAAITVEKDSVRRELKNLIINLRAKGYNDREISEIIGYSNSFVNKLRSEVETEFEKVRYD